MLKTVNASFSRGVGTPGELESSPRVAFAGRSNVGKSTLLNRLVRRKNLARSSGTPGCTKEFNVYAVELVNKDGSNLKLQLVDFPGFGYAKFSQAERKRLRRSILDFVENDEHLKVLCLLNDARRMPEEDELLLRELAAQSGVHVLIVVTKTDKLKRNDVKKQLASIASAYGLQADDVIAAGDDMSPDVLWIRLQSFFE